MADPTETENASIAIDDARGKLGRVIDLSRFVGPLAAIGCVLVALAIGSVVVRANSGMTPSWLDPIDPTMGNAMLPEHSAKIGTLIREGWGGHGSSKPRLGILLGSSSTRYGFDTTILEAESDAPMRWLNLGTNGGNAEDIYRIGRMVLQSVVKPDVVVLGLHQEMLPRTIEHIADETSIRFDKLVTDSSQGSLRATFNDVCNISTAGINRAFPRRSHTNYHFREAALEAKLRFFRGMNIGVDGLFAPDPKLWKNPVLERAYWATTDNLTEIPELLAVVISQKGILVGPNYRVDGPNSQAVLKLIDDCDREKIRLIIVITPQLRMMRDTLPAASFDCLNKVLEGRDGRPLEILDLRTAIPETHFIDILHVNEVGREEMTRHLVARLKTTPDAKAGDKAKRP